MILLMRTSLRLGPPAHKKSSSRSFSFNLSVNSYSLLTTSSSTLGVCPVALLTFPTSILSPGSGT
jgi:hypothetical protein